MATTSSLGSDAHEAPRPPVTGTVPGTHYIYDPRGRLTTTTQGSEGAGSRTTASPNQGTLESVTDPLGRSLRYEYDPAGCVTVQTFPTGAAANSGLQIP